MVYFLYFNGGKFQFIGMKPKKMLLQKIICCNYAWSKGHLVICELKFISCLACSTWYTTVMMSELEVREISTTWFHPPRLLHNILIISTYNSYGANFKCRHLMVVFEALGFWGTTQKIITEIWHQFIQKGLLARSGQAS